MAIVARQFPDYASALKASYEEEIEGQAFFAGLAARHPERGEALRLIARIEHVTADILRPAVVRAGITPADPGELTARGQAEAAADNRPWAVVVHAMAQDYPTYVQEMAQTLAKAPPRDRAAMAALVAHEQAIVDFALADLRGDDDCLRPLLTFLEHHERDQTRAW